MEMQQLRSVQKDLKFQQILQNLFHDHLYHESPLFVLHVDINLD